MSTRVRIPFPAPLWVDDMASLKQLEKEIKEIKKRNKKVEGDKAWEISYFRRFAIAIFTYIAIGLLLVSIDAKNPWLNALVPAFAFLLSTWTLPFIKKWWLNKSF